MPKRPWLEIQLPWYDVATSFGEGQATIVSYQKNRLPWLKSASHVVAVIDPIEHKLKFYDVEAISELKKGMKPFWSFDQETISLNALSELTSWPSVEALYTRFTRFDLSEEFRSMLTINEFIKRWQLRRIRGWWIIERRGVGITLVREFVDVRDNAKHAVELSYRGLSMFKHDLLRGSEMSDRDKILYLKIEQLELDKLINIYSKDDIMTIRCAARQFRYIIYEMAMECELPF